MSAPSAHIISALTVNINGNELLRRTYDISHYESMREGRCRQQGHTAIFLETQKVIRCCPLGVLRESHYILLPLLLPVLLRFVVVLLLLAAATAAALYIEYCGCGCNGVFTYYLVPARTSTSECGMPSVYYENKNTLQL